MSIVQANHIEHRETRSGLQKAFVRGTRISVQDIYVSHELMGQTPDEIVAAHPHLTLAHVHAALAYCFDHLDEIRQQIQDDKTFVDEFRKKAGPGPLARKLNPPDADDNPLSS